MAKRGFGDSGNGNLDEVTHEDVNSHLMELRNKEGVKVVAKATPLASIWADVRQPRRAIPASIRLHWDGSPDAVEPLLMQWDAVVRNYIDLDTRGIIRGNGDGIDLEGMPTIVESYVALLRLASDIKHVGLTNPITVVKQGQRHLIESGERRYLAHHLLVIWDVREKWDKIPAIISDGKDFVWRQASENTARRSLNPIGMARQLALLIMDAREGMDGVKYDAYEDLVLPGSCDRRYYAQVANGTIHRIPKGLGERIQGAMGLSEKRLADYRNLLKLTDDNAVNDQLWVRADVEDWAEGIMREIGTLPIGKVSEVLARDEWSLDDLRTLIAEEKALKEAEKQAIQSGVDSRREREREERIEEARQKIRERDSHRDWQREHEERTEKYDDDLTYGDEDHDDGDEYIDHGGKWMPTWGRGTYVILDEPSADWKKDNTGVYRPHNAYIIPAGTTARVKQLFTQRTKKGEHSLCRIAVGAYEHVVPVQVLALDAQDNTDVDDRPTVTDDDHIAALTGDEVAQGMASDNGDSEIPLQGGVMIFVDSDYGDKVLLKTLFNLMSQVDRDAMEAVREMHNVTLRTIEKWHERGEMNDKLVDLYNRIQSGLEKVMTKHILIMMENVQNYVSEGDDA